MSDLTHTDASGSDAPYDPPTAGAVLRAAREAAGLSIDAVAQQLKLAPRQVQAIEDDDYARLPGRTFVRGFVRNYARFFGLDADEVVSLLPGADVAPSLERPTITPSGRPMGELPAETPARRAWTGWAIALALLALVSAAGIYEFRRQQAERHAGPDRTAPAPVASAPVTVVNSGTTSASLPNPLGSDASTAAAPAASAPSTGVATATQPSTSPPGTAPPAIAVPDASPAAPSAGNPAADGMLVLTFKGSSWVQVKDRNGNVVLAQTGQPGSTQAVSGALPIDIVIGNAAAVSATFRGQPVDLGPHVRANVARLSLK